MAEQGGKPALLEKLLTIVRFLSARVHSLREWIRVTRARTRDGRRGGTPAAPQPRPVDEPGAREPSLGEVPIVDLFVILVDGHGFEVREAVRLLTIGMLAAGYEADSEQVAAADAMDIVEVILGRERKGSG